jgi:hypothetical protein
MERFAIKTKFYNPLSNFPKECIATTDLVNIIKTETVLFPF